MPSYPDRCQHIKVNGTQCGSPALRRGKFCFFHKRWHEQRLRLNAKSSHRARSLDLPVLEDANSVQVALMQVMRLVLSGELDGKAAGLLLYALQTASSNLRRTSFEPLSMHGVVLDPRAVANSQLGEDDLWSDEDFEEEEEEEGEKGEKGEPQAAQPQKEEEELDDPDDANFPTWARDLPNSVRERFRRPSRDT